MKNKARKKLVLSGRTRQRLLCGAAALTIVFTVTAGSAGTAFLLTTQPQTLEVSAELPPKETAPVRSEPVRKETAPEQPLWQEPEQDQPQQTVEAVQGSVTKPVTEPVTAHPAEELPQAQQPVQEPEQPELPQIFVPQLPWDGADIEQENSFGILLQETPELAAQDPMADPATANRHHETLEQQMPQQELLLTPEELREALEDSAVEEQCLPIDEENCLKWLWEILFESKKEYSGWRTVDDKTYYYDPETHQKCTGIQSIEEKLYYFDADGVMQEGVTFGIDVSKYQTDIDWQQIKKAGVSFVIIRIGYRGYGAEGKLVLDPMFEEHFTNARNAGLKVGVYFFSQAVNEEEAREEAFGCAYVLNGRALDLPVYFDTELSTSPTGTGRADALGVTERTDCAIAFCEEIKLNGYLPGVYASTNWFNGRVEYDRLTDYSIWNAHYGVPESPIPCDLWQGSCTVRISGHDGLLDANISYMQ